MRHDVDKVVDYTWGFAGHVMTPINLIQCIYYLTQIFGISFMAGVAVFCLGTYINTKLNEKIHERQQIRNKLEASRYNQGLESISYIKTLKFYQWSDKFRTQMVESKIMDMAHLRMIRYFCCTCWACGAFFPNMVSTSSFFLSAKLGKNIDLSSVYLALTFLEKIRGPMDGLPNSIKVHREVKVHVERIHKYLEMPEMPQIVK